MTVSYGSLPSQALRTEARAARWVALLAVLAVGSVALVSLSHSATQPTELAQRGGWLTSISNAFSDSKPTASQLRLQQALNQAPQPQRFVRQPAQPSNYVPTTSEAVRYSDGLTGARFDRPSKMSLAEKKDDKESDGISPLDKMGVDLDHWPWDKNPAKHSNDEAEEDKESDAKGEEGAGEAEGDDAESKKDSLVEELMSDFKDRPHSNPLLSKKQIQALRERREMVAVEKERAQAQARRRYWAEKRAEQLRAMAVPRHPLMQLEEAGNSTNGTSAEEPSQRAVGEKWNAHNDHCMDDTPNCNKLGNLGVHVYGWPEYEGVEDHETANLLHRQQRIATMLSGNVNQLEGLIYSRGGGADQEEALSQKLQADSFQLEKLATLQKLEEASNSTNGTKEADGEKEEREDWTGFIPAWNWEHQDNGNLKEDGKVTVDQWPWESVAQAVRQRMWERTIAQKLRADASDVSKLASADAQMGNFRGVRSHEASSLRAKERAEAVAKKQWEERLAREVGADARFLHAFTNRQLRAKRLAFQHQRAVEELRQQDRATWIRPQDFLLS